MAVFRIEKTRDYTVMSNHHLRDKSLSLKAKGLLSLMLSLPEEWDYTTKGLARICKDGVDSICAGVRELEEHGYVIRQRVRNANGQLGAIEYTIRCWTAADAYWDTYFKMYERLRNTFAKHNVEMSYDHLNVHVVPEKQNEN